MKARERDKEGTAGHMGSRKRFFVFCFFFHGRDVSMFKR